MKVNLLKITAFIDLLHNTDFIVKNVLCKNFQIDEKKKIVTDVYQNYMVAKREYVRVCLCLIVDLAHFLIIFNAIT